MDLLKAEIERKRRAVELAKSSSEVGRVTVGGGGGSSSPSKQKKKKQYLKASDLRKFQERQEEKEEEERRRRGREGKKRRREESDEGGSSEKAAVGTAGKRGGPSDGKGGAAPKQGGDGDGAAPRSRSSKEDAAGGGKASQADSASAAAAPGGNAKEKRRKKDDLSPEQVTRMLRDLGLPVCLFGERDSQRLDRLHEATEQRKAAAAGMSEMDEFRLGSGHGIRNPFLGGKREDDDEDDGGGKKPAAAAADKKAAGGRDGGKAAAAGGNGRGKGGKGGGGDDKAAASAPGDRQEDDADDADDPHKLIHRFFKSLLRQWEDDLAHRPDAAKRTVAGRNETKTLKQCKDYIRPLFKLCKTRRLEPGMTAHMVKIVKYCKEGEFVTAHDAYIDVAIGRAAWPIGVTMVGIHARSGREKIGSANVAHVMNSELQRKYLTSVKRLMSYCQKKRTDVDPSKKVLNM